VSVDKIYDLSNLLILIILEISQDMTKSKRKGLFQILFIDFKAKYQDWKQPKYLFIL